MKRALILAGGGARGSFQAGVWKYLVQIGWEPDIICGTSIGDESNVQEKVQVVE